jgi:dTDP-4-dehydrorhamnose reductase
MRITVTGAAGLVGGPLVRRLSERHEVTGIDLPELDVRDGARVLEALRLSRPNVVAHLAAMTDVDGCERDPAAADAVNAQGTLNVAVACRELGTDMLYVSTDYIFDGRKTTPYVEEDAPHPLSAYGRSKLAGEMHVREVAPRWWIVRCQSIYGAGRKSFVDAILARAASGGALRVVTDQRVSPSWCEDVAEGIAAALLRAPHGLYLLSNSGSCTWYECARDALDLMGFGNVPIEPITAAELARPAPRPANSVFDCTKLERATGFRARPWRDALSRYLSRAPQESAK